MHRIAAMLPWLFIAQFAVWLWLPQIPRMLGLGWTQYTLLLQLVVVYPAIALFAMYYDRRSLRRLRPYLDAHEARVCLNCFYPTVDIPEATPARTRCPECGGTWDPDELAKRWKARRTLTAGKRFIPRLLQRKEEH